ncbi:uncharacterized protein LOC111869196 isoform X2 [Cryptotermes secundus]|uniref:uncharacterized protein LOC111869196 isoform X2 n=1 Tax=Cryptotermes secundus TaxID=105785 RepID=UPI001454D7FB|nr:uncharacterized protein LOC111869196 isoform X2 [Cryptotermes secundus]
MMLNEVHKSVFTLEQRDAETMGLSGEMYRRILLWTTSPIHHAAVHLKGIFRKTLKRNTFVSVLGPTLIDNKLLCNSPVNLVVDIRLTSVLTDRSCSLPFGTPVPGLPIHNNLRRPNSSHFPQSWFQFWRGLTSECTWKCTAIICIILSVVLAGVLTYVSVVNLLSWPYQSANSSTVHVGERTEVSPKISAVRDHLSSRPQPSSGAVNILNRPYQSAKSSTVLVGENAEVVTVTSAETNSSSSRPRPSSGELCDLDCGSHGHCVGDSCMCNSGWSGDYCTLKQCDPRCNEHGQCKNGTCWCMMGWNGRHCTMEGCPNSCSRHGQCRVNSDGAWECYCYEGWDGQDCSVALEQSCSDGRDNDDDGLTDCEDPECCSNLLCRSSQLCVSAPKPIDILLRKQPPAITASFFERMNFLIEEESLQYYAHQEAFNKR